MVTLCQALNGLQVMSLGWDMLLGEYTRHHVSEESPVHYRMLTVYPAFHLSSYILSRDHQGWFRSNKLLKSNVSCELAGNFISSYPRISRDPKQPYTMPGGNIIQHLLVLLYQWRRYFGSLKGFQSHLNVTANANVYFGPSIHLNFMRTGQSSIYLSWENCSILS
jgi:hypothetical protein